MEKTLIDIRWENEPDLDKLRQLHELAARDPKSATAGLVALADRGSAASMWYLADIYMGQDPALKSIDKGKHWYARAEKMGIVQASHMLGRISFEQNDYDTAFSKFSVGQRAGYAPSAYRLALMYGQGVGIPINKERCRMLLAEAAVKGHLFAKRDLMTLYLRGAFGLRLFVRGITIAFSLLKDIVLLKSMRSGPELEERTLC